MKTPQKQIATLRFPTCGIRCRCFPETTLYSMKCLTFINLIITYIVQYGSAEHSIFMYCTDSLPRSMQHVKRTMRKGMLSHIRKRGRIYKKIKKKAGIP